MPFHPICHQGDGREVSRSVDGEGCSTLPMRGRLAENYTIIGLDTSMVLPVGILLVEDTGMPGAAPGPRAPVHTMARRR